MAYLTNHDGYYGFCKDGSLPNMENAVTLWKNHFFHCDVILTKAKEELFLHEGVRQE